MSRQTLLTKAADAAQRATVLGLLSFFGFQAYQIGKFVYERKVDSPYMHSTYREEVDAKVREGYRTDNVVDGRNQRDWYAEDDDEGYRRDQVRANITTPEFKKQYNNRQRERD